MINIHEAKTHLSRLVERAAAGEEIVIAKAGVPMARLGPLVAPRTQRRPGIWRGLVQIAHDTPHDTPPHETPPHETPPHETLAHLTPPDA